MSKGLIWGSAEAIGVVTRNFLTVGPNIFLGRASEGVLSEDKESNLYKTISDSIKKFEENDIKIIRYEVKKTEPIEIKKIKKTVASTIDITELISKLDWELVDVNDTNCQILVVSDKNEINEKVEYAKSNGIKIMTIKQIELVFN